MPEAESAVAVELPAVRLPHRRRSMVEPVIDTATYEAGT